MILFGFVMQFAALGFCAAQATSANPWPVLPFWGPAAFLLGFVGAGLSVYGTTQL